MVNAIITPGEVLAGVGLLRKFGYLLELNTPKNTLKLFREGEVG